MKHYKIVAGLVVLALLLSVGTVFAKKAATKTVKKYSTKGVITKQVCQKYRGWELSGLLTKNSSDYVRVVESCRGKYRSLMYGNGVQTPTGKAVKYSADGKKPTSYACKIYRKWELTSMLTKNSSDYQFVIEYCRKKFPTVMKPRGG